MVDEAKMDINVRELDQLGYHCRNCNHKSVLNYCKRIEYDVTHDTMCSPSEALAGRILPKTLLILYDEDISAYPYVPTAPEGMEAWSRDDFVWMIFDTRKNGCLQKNGGILARRFTTYYAIEVWKAGKMLGDGDLDFEGSPYTEDLVTLCRLISEMFDAEMPVIPEGGLLTIEILEQMIKSPMFYPENWREKYDLVEETELMLIVKPKVSLG